MIFANNHIIIPTGAATDIALPSTNRVLSKRDLTITFPIWGFLYGGSSKIKEEGIPFSIVFERIFETISVNIIPKSTTNRTHNVDIKDEAVPTKITSYKYCT